MRIAVMIIFLMQKRVTDAEFVQHSFVGVALAVLFENGFADKFGGHLLLALLGVGLAVFLTRRWFQYRAQWGMRF